MKRSNAVSARAELVDRFFKKRGYGSATPNANPRSSREEKSNGTKQKKVHFPDFARETQMSRRKRAARKIQKHPEVFGGVFCFVFARGKVFCREFPEQCGRLGTIYSFVFVW